MSWKFIEAIPADPEIVGSDDCWWAVVFNPTDAVQEIVDDCFESKREAEAGGRDFCRYMNGADNEDRIERAMECGMLHGIDAYNDAMGY